MGPKVAKAFNYRPRVPKGPLAKHNIKSKNVLVQIAMVELLGTMQIWSGKKEQLQLGGLRRLWGMALLNPAAA